MVAALGEVYAGAKIKGLDCMFSSVMFCKLSAKPKKKKEQLDVAPIQQPHFSTQNWHVIKNSDAQNN